MNARFKSPFLRPILVYALFATGIYPAVVVGAPPVIRTISPLGLTTGQTTTLNIVGANLAANPRLILGDAAGVQQQVKQKVESAAAGQCSIAVTLPADAAPGIFALRLATDEGISAPLMVGVDALPQQAFSPGAVVTPPVSLSGSLTGGAILQTSFVGRQGERVVVDVESRRLGAKLNPVIRLLDDRGAQIAWSHGRGEIGGDARCEVVLPADGAYTVQLHDKLYRGAGPGHFRLKIGDLHYADFAMPLGVTQGAAARLELLGDLAADAAIQEVNIPSDAPPVSRHMLRLPASKSLTGAAPMVFVSPFPELAERAESDGQPQSISAAPVAVSGRLADSGQTDRYAIAVNPGDKLRIELLAARIGSPMDGVVDVLRENGQRLAGNDDQKGTTDPGLDFTVPGGVNKIVLTVRDMVGHGGDRAVYRLSVLPAGRPDFSLSVAEAALLIPASSQRVVKVTAKRDNYTGPIKLIVHGLPSGVSVAGDVMPAGSNIALLTLTGAGEPSAGVCVIEGRSVGGQPPLRRVAERPGDGLTAQHPYLSSQLGWAVTKASPLQLAWRTNADDALALGAKLPASISVQRGEGAEGEVRLSLLTNQVIPKKKIKNKKTKKDELVDDVDRALRFEGQPVIAGDAKETIAQIIVPADLPARKWDLIVQGELLSADKKTVVATAYTPLKSFDALSPLRLEIASADKIEARAGAGETGKLTGAVHRTEGFKQPVTISLAGLPQGYTAEATTVPAEQTDFSFPVRFAYGSKPGQLKNVRVVATAQANPADAAQVVRSNEVPVAIEVVPGEKPPAEPPLAIFEDDAKFPELLTQGNGKISLESGDKHSGAASVKVTPDQRYAPALASLGQKIREKPSAPDEFRYLRFAWKKQGGASICLQINHDGAWGPGGSGKEGAKFRYHAGGGGECYGASVTLDEKLPGDWVVVTRDLFADFGEFTFTGIALSPVDGEFALFDGIYLGKTPADFDLAKP